MITAKDVTAFDRGYLLGYIHCLEQIRMALTEGAENGFWNLHPTEQAKRISVMIEAAREEFGEKYGDSTP